MPEIGKFSINVRCYYLTVNIYCYSQRPGTVYSTEEIGVGGKDMVFDLRGLASVR